MAVSEQANLSAYDIDAAPEGACVRYEVCGNVVPGRGQMCGPCLDELRAADREQREEP
jgi:hypothetical protein